MTTRWMLVAKFAVSKRFWKKFPMLAMTRWVFVFTRKEGTIAYRYNRAHPHFKWYLGLDAVLTSLLVFGGVAFAYQPMSSFRMTQLEHSGAVAMSSTEFIRHINGKGDIAYWLGPISGHKYTHADNSLSVITMTYWPQGSNIDIAKQSDLTVATYDNLAAYTTSIHPIENPNTARLVASIGTTVKFNGATMDYEIVTFKGKPEIVVVYYPTWQLSATLMKNAEALKRVS